MIDWLGFEICLDILEAVGELIICHQALFIFSIFGRLAWVAFKSFGIPCRLRIMILIANLNWRNLTNEVVRSQHPKDNLVIDGFSIPNLLEFWLCCEVSDIVCGLICLLLNWHHCLHEICLSQLMCLGLRIFHKWAAQRTWPNILGGIVHAYGFSSSIFQPVVD